MRNNYEAHKLSLLCHQMFACYVFGKETYAPRIRDSDVMKMMTVNKCCMLQSNVQKTSQINLLDYPRLYISKQKF